MKALDTVVLTGGSGGIGRTIADAFIQTGARVATIDLQPLPSEAMPGATHIVGDVRDEHFITSVFEEFLGDVTPLSALVNCAGVMQRASFQDGALDEMRDLIGINLTGTVVPAKVAIPYLTRATDGAIVNIGSIWASHVWPARSIYSATKAAVEQLSRCMAVDLADLGIRVHCVSPGLVATSFTESVVSSAAFMESFMTRVPAGRAMEPEEVATAVVALARGDLRFALGDPVTLHGGYY